MFDYGNWLALLGQKWQQLAQEAQKRSGTPTSRPSAITSRSTTSTSRSMDGMTDENMDATYDAIAKLQPRSEEVQTTYAGEGGPDRVTVDRPPPAGRCAHRPRSRERRSADTAVRLEGRSSRRRGPATARPHRVAVEAAVARPVARRRTPSMPRAVRRRRCRRIRPAANRSRAAARAPVAARPRAADRVPAEARPSGSPTGLPGGGSEDMPVPARRSGHASRGRRCGWRRGRRVRWRWRRVWAPARFSPAPVPCPSGRDPRVPAAPGGAPAAAGARRRGDGRRHGWWHGRRPRLRPSRGKEKRRTPGLSPDEDLYVEDRAVHRRGDRGPQAQDAADPEGLPVTEDMHPEVAAVLRAGPASAVVDGRAAGQDGRRIVHRDRRSQRPSRSR